MPEAIIKTLIEEFTRGRDMPPELAETFLDALISETDEPRIAAVLTAWNKKGIVESEICEFAQILRSRMIRIRTRHHQFADIVGTGGSRAKTFNVSTAASFVAAGAGLPVAKHGNRSATSNSGNSDVLSQLGVDPAVDPQTAEKCLDELGICFMFAPKYHQLSPTLARVRRRLGFPTIFNCVGPLCNPASAPFSLIGAWDKNMLPKMASALSRLGTQRTWLVCGLGGLDEIALDGPTEVAEVSGNSMRSFEITAEFFGFESMGTGRIRSSDAAHSASMITNTLLGQPHHPAAENIVVLNAAAALYISGAAADPVEAGLVAKESLKSGRALRKLRQLAKTVPA